MDAEAVAMMAFRFPRLSSGAPKPSRPEASAAIAFAPVYDLPAAAVAPPAPEYSIIPAAVRNLGGVAWHTWPKALALNRRSLTPAERYQIVQEAYHRAEPFGLVGVELVRGRSGLQLKLHWRRVK